MHATRKQKQDFWLNRLNHFLEKNDLFITQCDATHKNLYISDKLDKDNHCVKYTFGRDIEECYYKLVEWFTQDYSIFVRPRLEQQVD